MPWLKHDDKAHDHPKIRALSDAAFRLWYRLVGWCGANLSDGRVPRSEAFGCAVAQAMSSGNGCTHEALLMELTTPVPGFCNPLLHDRGTHFEVHDYLDYNPSRTEVEGDSERRALNKALFSDPELVRAVRDRDGDACRYCGRGVRWSDKKGGGGGTYDRVDPAAPVSPENIVVSCRSCCTRKAGRAPEDAGLALRGAADEGLKRDSNPVQNKIQIRDQTEIQPPVPVPVPVSVPEQDPPVVPRAGGTGLQGGANRASGR
jgi:hypothetical protein